MTEPQVAPKAKEYPTSIVDKPFDLDDLIFTPNDARRIERATRGDTYIGDVLHDDNRFWFARKIDANGELSDWKPMRSVAEARAYLVSRIRE